MRKRESCEAFTARLARSQGITVAELVATLSSHDQELLAEHLARERWEKRRGWENRRDAWQGLILGTVLLVWIVVVVLVWGWPFFALLAAAGEKLAGGQ
jgi:hypothetical protein